MAFEQPLEADKIGDNSLVSLIRDPIIGALTWILVGPGGSSNKIMMDDDNSSSSSSEVEQQLQRELEDMVLSDDSYGSSGWSRQESRYPSSGEEEGRLPRLVRSEVSVSEQQQQQQPTTMSRVKATVELNTSSSSPTSNPHIGGEKKKMSWSENLVEYMDESGCRHEPPPAGPEGSIAAKPIKSAMTRSQSIRSNHNNGIMGDLEAATTTTGSGSSSHGDSQQRRYIPKMDRAHHGGLIMPTRPMGTTSAADHHSKSAGVESPQWGWYINTTPPTPEMYHSRSSMFKHNHSNSSSDYSFTSTTASTSSDVSQYQAPNRVFQGLKASSNKPHMGWPSVPL